MMSIRSFALLAILIGIVSLGWASGAFTEINAERSSAIGVAENGSALIELDIARPVQVGQNKHLVTVTNNIENTKVVVIELTKNTDDGVALLTSQKTIPSGESATYRVDIDPDERPTIIEFNLRTGGPTSVELTRRTRIEDISACEGDRLVIDSDKRGSIRTSETVEVKRDITIKGSVSNARCLIVRERGSIKGKIEDIRNTVDLGTDASTGKIKSVGGSVSIGSESRVSGGIQQIDGDLTIDEDVSVKGTIQQIEGDVTVHEGTVISGNVQKIGGDVILVGEPRIKGRIRDVDGEIIRRDE